MKMVEFLEIDQRETTLLLNCLHAHISLKSSYPSRPFCLHRLLFYDLLRKQ